MADALAATPQQVAFIEAALSGRYTILGYGGAIRGGKSWAAYMLVVVLMRVFPGSRWAIVRRDFPRLRRNALPSWAAIRPKNFIGPVNGTTWEAEATNGSRILFVAESYDTDPDLERFKGLEVNGFIFEEGSECREKTANKAIERAGSWVLKDAAGRKLPDDLQPAPLVGVTFNPTPEWPRYWFYEPWLAGTLAPPYFYQPADIRDNPHLPKQYVENLQQLKGTAFDRYVGGDWNYAGGRALNELSETTHLVPPFTIPPTWKVWGAFDWGFSHPFVFMVLAVNPDGKVFVVHVVRGRRLRDDGIIGRILEQLGEWGCPPERLSHVEAGHDCWSVRDAFNLGEQPTTQERFFAAGFQMRQAITDRAAGLRQLREYTAVAGLGATLLADGSRAPGEPMLVWFDTAANRTSIGNLQRVLMDADAKGAKAEDAKKVDADPETGEGGDDDYDCLRYGMARRPPRIASSLMDQPLDAFSTEALKADIERRRHIAPHRRKRNPALDGVDGY